MFELRPFSPIKCDLCLRAEVKHEEGQLNIRFTVSGEIDQILFPSQSPNPSRRDELWKKTCFEVFFGPRGRVNYWELNFSPSGDWNCYSFDDYRAGMKAENRILVQPIRFSEKTDRIEMETSVDISDLIESGSALEQSSNAVIESDRGELSYWAIRHAGTQPDFHLRESFVPLT